VAATRQSKPLEWENGVPISGQSGYARGWVLAVDRFGYLYGGFLSLTGRLSSGPVPDFQGCAV